MVPRLRAVCEDHHTGFKQAGIVKAARREKDQVGKPLVLNSIGEPQTKQKPRVETLPFSAVVMPQLPETLSAPVGTPRCDEWPVPVSFCQSRH